MKAVVLSGGGAKGSYQIGVWKALRKLHIKYDIITGTSVGALNGALMVQGKYHGAIKLWKNINFDLLFGKGKIKDTSTKLRILKNYSDSFFKEGGMDVKELEQLVSDYINTSKFYRSKIDFGLVTFNYSKRQAEELKKEDIPRDKLVDYLMASATCFPAFKKSNIDGNSYIDGGYYDNMPINLAIDLGADEVIAVNLSAPGKTRKPKKNIKITTIKPNNDLSFFLDFNNEPALRNIKYGYNDTLKAFNKLEGNTFTFKLNSLKKNYNAHKETYLYCLNSIINKKIDVKAIPILKNITNDKYLQKYFYRIMENVGSFLQIDDTPIYNYKKYNKRIIKKFDSYMKSSPKKGNFKTIKSIYDCLATDDFSKVRRLLVLHPSEFLMALYIYVIKEV